MNAYLALFKEKGTNWILCRSLYFMKLRLLKTFPRSEELFEKKTKPVVRINFFDYDVSRLQEYLLGQPDEYKDQIIKKADSACSGRIQGFSSVLLDYGQPIRWNMNPLTKKEWNSAAKWYAIPDFDKDKGDIKAVWEISRFTHFFDLARAFLITNDMKYVEAYFNQISSWVRSNKYSYGPNYKCGQECSLRMLSCLLTSPCFIEYATVDDENNIRKIVEGSYKKVLGNFFYAHRCIKNNHTISELVGMIIGSWCTDDTRRMVYAYNTLEKTIEEQFSEDGGYIQQSFNYQRLALQDLIVVLGATEKTGYSLSDESKSRILNSAIQLFQCQADSGDVPNYGSNDGAHILPLTSGGYRDYRPVINSINALITGTVLYDYDYLNEELIWLNIRDINNRSIIHKVTQDFSNTGLSAFRNKLYFLMVVCKYRIGHMDQGHVDLWIGNKNILCDAGSYSYASELGQVLSSTKGHNTLYPVDTFQINRIGAFSVYGQPFLKERIVKDNSISFHVVYSTGYEHKRKIIVDENMIEISDEILGFEQDSFVLFHTPCKISIIDDKTIDLGSCIMSSDSSLIMQKAKRSLLYLQSEEITCITIPCKKTTYTKILIKENNKND